MLSKNIKILTAMALTSMALVAVGVAAGQANPYKVGAETEYVCEGGYYQPISDLSGTNSQQALATALGGDETPLKNNALPKTKSAGAALSNYFDTTVSATIGGDSAYSLYHNLVIVKGNKGTITIKFNQPVIRVVAQVAEVNSVDDLSNLTYTSQVIDVVNNQITIKGTGAYLLIGKLTFRLPK